MSLENILDRPLNDWMKGGGQEGDVVLSSRIRLARNFETIPFPHRATDKQLHTIVETLRNDIKELGKNDEAHKYIFIELEQIPLLERYALVEKHLISPKLAEECSNRAVIVRDDGEVVIMINEEDHLRIQCMTAGLDLQNALKKALLTDDILEGSHNFGYSESFGYITACPTNVGTGLRASIMLHLPGLALTRKINHIIGAATQIGLAVRGLYGEGSEAAGNIYQISNQLTLGQSEQEIVDNLYNVANQIVKEERMARKTLLEEAKLALSDRVWRAFGLLRYARSISGQEALGLLSELRLGIDLKIIEKVHPVIFNELLVMTRPNFLQKFSGKTNITPNERDSIRADIIREKLNTSLQGG